MLREFGDRTCAAGMVTAELAKPDGKRSTGPSRLAATRAALAKWSHRCLPERRRCTSVVIRPPGGMAAELALQFHDLQLCPSPS